MTRITAERDVAASPEELFALLADLERHWLLADRFVEVVGLNGGPGARDGGVVRIRGPLGVRRTATVRVLEMAPARSVVGTATLGTRTTAQVTWALAPTQSGTRVELSAAVERASPLDRVLLTLGGRLWLHRRFEATLARLERLALPRAHRPVVAAAG